ncbi:unnamed protein product [Heligmosomoides polygyrus]|uniref:ANF_receptor domain-containing protein n=1 Tax=Heligmosomoides polygyrus TaxID=6339 RepID=A0A183FQP6_HELPZ|nr:unnamed protein product [Heligmosomoides polygyrus]
MMVLVKAYAHIPQTNVYGYLYLFDSLKLYALAARKVMNDTGGAKNIINGRAMWNAMRKLKFTGMLGSSGVASGIVSMDDRAERAPLYRGFFVSPNVEQITLFTTRDVRNFRFRVPNSGFRPFLALPFRSVFRLFLDRKAETEMATAPH